MSIQSEINRITTAVSDQESLIGEIVDALAARCVVTEPILQSKTVTPTEEVQTVTPDNGYDGLSSVTVEAAQGGEGTYGWKKSVSKLPSGYTEVEYLQSSGTQHIDTGYVPNQGTEVVIDFRATNTDCAVFGSRIDYNDAAFTLYWSATNAAAVEIGTSFYSLGSLVNSNRHIVEMSNTAFILDGSTIHTYSTGNFTPNANMRLFHSGGADSLPKMQGCIYSCQLYDNGTLVRDFIPCTNPNDVAGLYDTVNGVFYTNAGTGTFMAGNPIRNDFPSGYTQIEYIESSGTQHIDTEFKANQNTRVTIDFTYLSGDVVFGAYDTGGKNGFGLQCASGKWYTYYGTSSGYGVAASANTRHLVDINKNVATIDGATLRTAAANTFQGSNPLILCALYNASTVGVNTSIMLYACKIYDNGTLVRDYVPCKNANGVVGLYDFVNKKFYANAGSGAFAAGAESKSSANSVVGYVVSDEADAYPDGGFLDGYYYKKLVA